jgi:septum site-determining protein MinC
MKVKQQTLKVFEFEIDESRAFTEYYTKNAPLIQGYLLMLSGNVTAEVLEFLDEKEAVYIDTKAKPLQIRKKRTTAVLDEPFTRGNASSTEVKMPGEKSPTVYYRTVRSGEEIYSDEELVFFGRINSGAVIESSGSVQIFGIIDGLVRSEGEYLLLQHIGQGSVFFHGEELDASRLDGKLKLIKYDNGIIFKDL